MKPMEDKKIFEQNVKLEEELKKEREEWKNKVIELVNMMKDNKKLSEAQVYQLSYRQLVQERLAIYRILIEKKQGQLENQMTARFREYSLSYDIKLSGSEKNAFVSADCQALKQQVNMIKAQITYFVPDNRKSGGEYVTITKQTGDSITTVGIKKESH